MGLVSTMIMERSSATILLMLLMVFQTVMSTGVYDYGQPKTLCGYGGSRDNCDPIDGSSVASFIDASFSATTCFLTDTDYTVAPPCEYLKHYANGVITFATGGKNLIYFTHFILLNMFFLGTNYLSTKIHRLISIY